MASIKRSRPTIQSNKFNRKGMTDWALRFLFCVRGPRILLKRLKKFTAKLSLAKISTYFSNSGKPFAGLTTR